MKNVSLSTTLTKKLIAKAIAQKYKIAPREAHRVVQFALELIHETLMNGQRVEFRGFGSFTIVKRKGKVGRNPRHASVPVTIPESYAVRFKSSKKAKEAIAACRKPST